MPKKVLLRAGVVFTLCGMVGIYLVWAQRVQSQAIPSSFESVGVVAQEAVSTEIRVYVLARGGKFLGDDVGGALVTIRDARTGEFVASGVTKGGSGVADLMTQGRPRTLPINTEAASVFSTTLMLDEPRLLEFEAFGPLTAQGSANRTTTTEWVLPQSFTAHGNRVILELAGLNVDVLAPQTHFLPQAKPPLKISFRVNVTMMCGCPIGPDLPWKPDEFKVMMKIKRPDGKQDLVKLEFDANAPDHAPSQFIGSYEATLPGIYEAIAMAHEAEFGNSGSDRVTFILP